MISTTALIIIMALNTIAIIVALFIGYNMGYKAKTGEDADMPMIDVKVESKPKQDNEEPKNFYE